MSTFIENVKLRLFALSKIPLINYVRPKILKITDDECELKIPLLRRNKNHVGSMYFGVLAVGCDLCIGLAALHHVNQAGKKIVIVFKDFKADFKKLAKGDVHFICEDGLACKKLVEKAIETGERQNLPVKGYAKCPSISNDVVMDFTLTLSIKVKS